MDGAITPRNGMPCDGRLSYAGAYRDGRGDALMLGNTTQ